MLDDQVLALCRKATAAVAERLAGVVDWGLVADSRHQHHSDLAADAAAVEVLVAGGLGVLSEESGLTCAERPLLAVLDPLDGSSNAAQGLRWYACSICVIDEAGPWVALVTNLASGVQYHAVRGAGAWRGEARLDVSEAGELPVGEAFVGLSGFPAQHLGWRQFRALGAAALDLCAVAEGTLDAWLDCSPDAHGVWDYLGGMLVCREAGATVVDLHGRDLVVCDPAARRTPVAARTPVLADQFAAALLAATTPSVRAMTADPLREAADALRQAQDACRAAWDACELALQNVLAAGGLLDSRAGEQIVSTTVTTAVPLPPERAAGAAYRSAVSGLECEECDMVDGHTIWCSKRWGAG